MDRGDDILKKPIYKHYRFWFALILAAIITFLGIELIIELQDNQVKNQLSKNRNKKYDSVTLIDELLSVRASLEEIRKELNNFKDTQ